MFIHTIPEAEAEGELRAIYEGDQETLGYVPDHARVCSLRPDVLEAWRGLQGSIRKNLRLRRYELVTVAAAKALKCRYCLLAHGAIRTKNGVGVGQLRAILTDFHDAGLDPAQVAIMDFAEKIVLSASEMTQADTDALRALGLEDVEILDISGERSEPAACRGEATGPSADHVVATTMWANIGKVTALAERYLQRTGSTSCRTASRRAALAGACCWANAGTAAAELVTASGTKRSGSENRTGIDSERTCTVGNPAAV